MLLWAAVILGCAVLAAGAFSLGAALAAQHGPQGGRAARWAVFWHRVATGLAVGWILALLWIFLDTLGMAVEP